MILANIRALKGRSFPGSPWLAISASNALFSGQNFLLSASVAQAVDLGTFGAFGILWLALLLLQGCLRGLIGEASIAVGVDAMSEEEPLIRRLRQGFAVSFVLASLFALGAFPSLPLLLGVVGAYFALHHDLHRFDLLALGRDVEVVVGDAIWLGIQTILTVGLAIAGLLGFTTALAAWGVGAGVGFLYLRSRPRPGVAESGNPAQMRPPSWRPAIIRRTRFAAENFAVGASAPLMLLVVGNVADLEVVGALRLVQVGFSFATVVQAGVRSVGSRGAGGKTLGRLIGEPSLVVAGSASIVASLLLLVPSNWMIHILGEGWIEARRLVVATVFARIGFAATSSITVALRVHLDGRAALPMRLATSTLAIVAVGVGAEAKGAVGAAWADAAVQCLVVAPWMWVLGRGLRSKRVSLA